LKTGRGCGQPGRGTDSRPSTACFPTTARNPDADSGSAVSSRFLCNEIVRQEGLGALSNDELYKLLNYRESRLKLSECLERAEKQSGVKDIPGKQNALAPEENKMEGPVQNKGTDVRQSSALIN
jgi:hypothetical protein